MRRWRELDEEAQWEQGTGGPCKGDAILHSHAACLLSPNLSLLLCWLIQFNQTKLGPNWAQTDHLHEKHGVCCHHQHAANRDELLHFQDGCVAIQIDKKKIAS